MDGFSLVSRTAGLEPEQIFTLYEKCVLPAVLAHKEKRKYEIPFMISPDLLGLQIFIKNGEDGLLFVATGVPISLVVELLVFSFNNVCVCVFFF